MLFFNVDINSSSSSIAANGTPKFYIGKDKPINADKILAKSCCFNYLVN